MNTNPGSRGVDSMSPVYTGRPAATMAVGLPVDEMCRGMSHARALRKAYFETLVDSRIAAPARKIAMSAKSEIAGWADNLHRGPFTSVI